MEVPRPSRTCSVSHRGFRPNEPFFSVITEKNGLFVRDDISAERWSGPPDEFIGWWRSTVTHVADNVAQQVSGETMQGLFERLYDMAAVQSGEADSLYILTLLLLRRKLLRYEKEITDEHGSRWLEVYAFHTDTTYQVPVAVPDHGRLEIIQQQLAGLVGR